MLTFPANSLPYQNQIGVENHIVVKLTDGVTTWLFSDTDMQLSDGHVYPLLISSDISIRHGIDIYSKRWEVGDVSIKISNAPYKTTDGTWIRFCDEVDDLQNQDVYIYFICGNRATALSDGLNKFIGEILEHPQYDCDYVTIRVVDKGKLKNKLLPTVNYETAAVALSFPAGVYNDQNVGKKIPLIYGSFTFAINTPYAGNGMAMGYALERGRCPEFVFADHVIDAITDLWSSPIGAFPLEYYSHTLDNDDSGYVTAIPARDESTKVYLWHRMNLIGSETYDYEVDLHLTETGYTDLLAAGTNPGYAYDSADDNYATVLDNLDDEYGDPIVVKYLFGAAGWSFHQSDESALMSLIHYNEELGLDTPFVMVYKVTMGTSITAEVGIELKYEEPGRAASGAYVTLKTNPTFNGSEQTETSTIADFAAVDRLCLALWASYDAAPEPPADGTPDNRTMMQVYYVKLKFGICHMPMAGNNTPITNHINIVNPYLWLGPGNPRINTPTPVFETASTGGPNESLAWAVCQGREFGSWIDDVSRTNLYDEGEYIENAPYIIESLLRDELGLADADIDMLSIDVAYNGSVTARLNQVKEEYAFDIIRRLTEQSDCCFMFDSVSRARLIDLGNASPTTNRNIPASHILPAYEGGAPYISVTKTPVYCNKMYLSSRWQGEYGIYRDVETVSNSTSQSAYGIYEGTYSWPNICGTSKTHIAGHLVSDADGLWSNPHVQIEFDTFGYSNADLEVGDWIELDDTTIDPHIKCFGESWSGKQFLVTELTQQAYSTRIKAVELY